MKFLEPKKNLKVKVDWLVSERTSNIIKHYAEYTGYSESEVVDEFLQNLLDDPKFKNWILNLRNNKRIIKDLSLPVEQEA